MDPSEALGSAGQQQRWEPGGRMTPHPHLPQAPMSAPVLTPNQKEVLRAHQRAWTPAAAEPGEHALRSSDPISVRLARLAAAAHRPHAACAPRTALTRRPAHAPGTSGGPRTVTERVLCLACGAGLVRPVERRALRGSLPRLSRLLPLRPLPRVIPRPRPPGRVAPLTSASPTSPPIRILLALRPAPRRGVVRTLRLARRPEAQRPPPPGGAGIGGKHHKRALRRRGAGVRRAAERRGRRQTCYCRGQPRRPAGARAPPFPAARLRARPPPPRLPPARPRVLWMVLWTVLQTVLLTPPGAAAHDSLSCVPLARRPSTRTPRARRRALRARSRCACPKSSKSIDEENL